jgi:CRP/FNR family cyclic AMP-dependent transcriptional regulator
VHIPGGFWSLLDEAERDSLMDCGRGSVFRPGDTMCVEGEPGTHVFVIVSGWVKIVSVTADGREMVLGLRGYGDVVGELAGDGAGYRTATVQALTVVQAIIVPFARFSAYLDAHQGAARAYRRMVTQRWGDAAAMLRSRSVHTGPQRIARLLLDLAERHGNANGDEIVVAVPLSQTELASLAGASRATVTRAFAGWRRRGLVDTGRRQVTITSVSAFRRVAGAALAEFLGHPGRRTARPGGGRHQSQ